MIFKIKVKSSGYHKIYANTTWSLDGSRLIQRIPYTQFERFEPTFREGDNLRLNGKVYHVTKYQSGLLKHEQTDFVVFVYELNEGEYQPKRWIQIGEITV